MTELWVNPPIAAMQKKALHLTDADIGAQLRMSAKTISRYINRGAPVPYPAAKLLAEVLDTDIRSLCEERLSQPPKSGRERAVDAALTRAAQPAPAGDQPSEQQSEVA